MRASVGDLSDMLNWMRWRCARIYQGGVLEVSWVGNYSQAIT